MRLEGLLDKALDAVYPRQCPVCGKASDRPRRLLCWHCLSQLEICSAETAACSICGLIPQGEVGKPFVCGDCRKRRPPFDLARSALDYSGAVRDLLQDFKYNGHIWLTRDFGDILEACARACFDTAKIDVVAPVPLYPAKFVLRSYNQAGLLADELASRLGVEYEGGLLSRLRDTPTQTHLGAGGRHGNIRAAFGVAAPELVEGRTVMVVDDVMTTGSTLGEIARILKKAGAWRVWCLTLARARMGR